MAILSKEVTEMPNKKKSSTNGEKHRVTIIMVGVPEAVMRVIKVLRLVGLTKATNWLEIKHNTQDSSELTVTIVIDFMP